MESSQTLRVTIRSYAEVVGIDFIYAENVITDVHAFLNEAIILVGYEK